MIQLKLKNNVNFVHCDGQICFTKEWILTKLHAPKTRIEFAKFKKLWGLINNHL